MSTLFGPALDAEVAYRQEQARSAYGRGSGRWGGVVRAGRRVAAKVAGAGREAASESGGAHGGVRKTHGRRFA